VPILLRESHDALSEMHGLTKLRGLLRQRPHEILRQHLGISGDVEDELLRVQRGKLSTELGQGVHDLSRGARMPA